MSSSEDFVGGGRQVTGCAGYRLERGARLIMDIGDGTVLRGAWRL